MNVAEHKFTPAKSADSHIRALNNVEERRFSAA
jgi:hypothetical protein